MHASGGVPGCAMIKRDMYKKYESWLCHKYDVNYMIMQSNMTMMERVIIKWNGGKLHGNISRNGYGNAIIGRYGGCFEEGKKVGVWHRRKLRGTREARKGGRVRVRIIHGLNISHKELTYLLKNSISHRNEVLRACS